LDLQQLRKIPPAQTTGTRAGAASTDRLDGRHMVAFITMWLGVVITASALEPPPANPDAAPALGALLGTVFVVGMIATAALALTRSRFHTAATSVVTGAAAVSMTVACPVVGHHHLALWWFAQLLVVTAPALWSYGQLRRTRSVPPQTSGPVA
jgi:hypothetical protein